ncbi:MAG: (2Fe-2S)-binding protein, partial [Planctomycetaceae bacterium]|nr:(2Fe-2S)-binding protein [Planctomycetaceae bacterium]
MTDQTGDLSRSQNGQNDYAPFDSALIDVSRREFFAMGGLAFVSSTGTSALAQNAASAARNADPEPVAVSLHVNGRIHQLKVDPRVTLLDALRNSIGLTGPKKGCDHGQCGACTVLVDGRRV